MHIDTNSRIGIGTSTFDPWNDTFRVIQFPDGAVIGSESGYAVDVVQGAYYNGAFKYHNSTNAAALCQLSNGRFIVRTTSSGTQGDNITWNECIWAEAGGDVGFGITDPECKVHIYGGTNVRAPHANAELCVEGYSGGANIAAINILSTGDCYLMFGDAADDYVGGFAYQHSINELWALANNTYVMCWQSDGDVEIYGHNIYIGYDINGGSFRTAADGSIYFAQDAYILWDESADLFEFSKPVLREIAYLQGNYSEQDIYNTFLAVVPSQDDEIILSGAMESSGGVEYVVSRIKNVGSSRLEIYCWNLDSSIVATIVAEQSDTTTTYDCSICAG
jgi:hypothetical protein